MYCFIRIIKIKGEKFMEFKCVYFGICDYLKRTENCPCGNEKHKEIIPYVVKALFEDEQPADTQELQENKTTSIEDEKTFDEHYGSEGDGDIGVGDNILDQGGDEEEEDRRKTEEEVTFMTNKDLEKHRRDL
jgi:hypothetical protein